MIFWLVVAKRATVGVFNKELEAFVPIWTVCIVAGIDVVQEAGRRVDWVVNVPIAVRFGFNGFGEKIVFDGFNLVGGIIALYGDVLQLFIGKSCERNASNEQTTAQNQQHYAPIESNSLDNHRPPIQSWSPRCPHLLRWPPLDLH